MLARIANNLFWMGRYIERAEHTARFMNVNYFSSLDAPNKLSRDRQFVLRSISSMVGDPRPEDEMLVEQDILYNVGLNPDKSYSILQSIKYARESAGSSRDLISTEFYECINKFYHYVMNYSKVHFVNNGLHDFTSHVLNQTSVLKGRLRGTMLHDEVYALIKLGINIERATQITRIIKTKFEDAEKTSNEKTKPLKNSFEWTTLLKCAESYDMNRRLYKKTPTQLTALEFLIVNPDCPRSVFYSLNQIQTHVEMLNPGKITKKNTAAFLIGKMKCEYSFKTVEEVQDDVKGFIVHTLNSLVDISNKLEEEYFYN